MKFVRITTVDNSYEAEFLKEDLEEAGVVCFLTNVNLTNLYPGMAGFYRGSGIGVMVSQEDHMKAAAIVRRRSEVERTVRCPNCGSTNVEHSPVSHSLWKIVPLFFAALLTASVTPFRDTYHCSECRSKFKR